MREFKRPTQAPFPYLANELLERLDVTGRWDAGGVVVVGYRDQCQAVVELSQTTFAVLAILAEAAERSRVEGWPRGYVTADDVAAKFLLRVGWRPGRQQVLKYVYHLRRAFEAALDAKVVDSKRRRRAVAMQLIEFQPSFGYRISIDPGRVRLEELSVAERSG